MKNGGETLTMLLVHFKQIQEQDAKLAADLKKGLITEQEYAEKSAKLWEDYADKIGNLPEVVVYNKGANTSMENIARYWEDVISNIDKHLNEDDLTVEARLGYIYDKQQAQENLDRITKGDPPVIKARVEPEYIQQGSSDWLHLNYNEADAEISRIVEEYNKGIIKTSDEAIEQIRKVNEELAKLQDQQKQKTEEEARRKAELDSLLNMDYTIVHYDIPDDPQPYAWEENEEITSPLDSLESLFKKTALSNGEIEYIYNGINTNYRENDTYMYFTVKDGVPGPLRFVVHYFADDPVDFYTLKFKLDRFEYEFTPKNIQHSTEDIYFSERFDEALTKESRDFAAGLAKCRYANILLKSNKVSHRLYISQKQLDRFRETYKLYRLMGGKIED